MTDWLLTVTLVPVAPVSATPKLNSSVNSASPSTVTGMVTLPGAFTLVVTDTVRVGAVASPSEATDTPDGHVHAAASTLAETCSLPRMAMTCVVQLPAFAALVEPGNV